MELNTFIYLIQKSDNNWIYIRIHKFLIYINIYFCKFLTF